jgi:hypothetical protein
MKLRILLGNGSYYCSCSCLPTTATLFKLELEHKKLQCLQDWAAILTCREPNCYQKQQLHTHWCCKPLSSKLQLTKTKSSAPTVLLGPSRSKSALHSSSSCCSAIRNSNSSAYIPTIKLLILHTKLAIILLLILQLLIGTLCGKHIACPLAHIALHCGSASSTRSATFARLLSHRFAKFTTDSA